MFGVSYRTDSAMTPSNGHVQRENKNIIQNAIKSVISLNESSYSTHNLDSLHKKICLPTTNNAQMKTNPDIRTYYKVHWTCYSMSIMKLSTSLMSLVFLPFSSWAHWAEPTHTASTKIISQSNVGTMLQSFSFPSFFVRERKQKIKGRNRNHLRSVLLWNIV